MFYIFFLFFLFNLWCLSLSLFIYFIFAFLWCACFVMNATPLTADGWPVDCFTIRGIEREFINILLLLLLMLLNLLLQTISLFLPLSLSVYNINYIRNLNECLTFSGTAANLLVPELKYLYSIANTLAIVAHNFVNILFLFFLYSKQSAVNAKSLLFCEKIKKKTEWNEKVIIFWDHTDLVINFNCKPEDNIRKNVIYNDLSVRFLRIFSNSNRLTHEILMNRVHQFSMK